MKFCESLREFIERLDEIGELRVIENADWNLEIGAITEIVAEKKGPALVFDRIKGYEKGFRVATNILTTPLRQKIALGMSPEIPDLEVVRMWKEKLENFQPKKPKFVDDAPVMENVMENENVNLLRFPVPKWHEHDGGRYIGTGSITITKDPDEGWVNLGTYRIMVQDEKTLSFYASPGKHATIMREKYWERGEDCPVVVSLGQDPLLWMCSTMPLQWGISEYELAGHIRGKAVEVVEGKHTNLPLPANAEIVIEGFSPPPEKESSPEGPFGEWTGYYASGVRETPVIKVKAIYFRDNPIIHGQPPFKPPIPTWPPIPIHSAPFVWSWLERMGFPGIKGVWIHGPGNRTLVVVSIKQMYLGHAMHVASAVASIYYGGALTGKFVVVVDDDIDPSDFDEVLWAITTRCDAESGIEIVRGFLTSPLDPSLSPHKRAEKNFTMAKVIVNACKPYHRIDEFPKINRFSRDIRERVLKKWNL